jgi:hypothetical protein
MCINRPTLLWKTAGQTLWQLQALEFALGHYLVLTRIVPGDKDRAYRELDKAFEFTLGRLVFELRKNVYVRPEIDGILKYFPDERNWFVHRMYRLHHTDIKDVERFTKLLNRINKLGEEALNLAKEFAVLCEKWCIANGITKKDINAEIARRLYA